MTDEEALSKEIIGHLSDFTLSQLLALQDWITEEIRVRFQLPK
jgi:hypothetical protein